MQISLEWLSEFLTWSETSPYTIAQRLTECTAEVEKVESQGALLGHCVVGRVVDLERHPRADRLSLCEVETERGRKRVVCGGINLRTGMLVAFAHVGAKVRWHGQESPVQLTRAMIRGEASEGMICAAEELDLLKEFPEAVGTQIIDLTERGYRVGQPLQEALELSDIIFHMPNTAITHRPDLFSHIGIARECVALGLGEWKREPHASSPEFPDTPLSVELIVEERALVPGYAACTIHIDSPGVAPAWMRRRLRALGWRTLSLPIDITNYVMLETGIPQHGFEVRDFRGSTVEIRSARDGESIVTLDGIERPLQKGAVVMSDAVGIFDLLGIMGGKRTSQTPETREILLQSVAVSVSAVRRTIQFTDFRTEGATIHEKGTPAALCAPALYRTLELFLSLCPGARITSSLVAWGGERPSPSLSLDLHRTRRVLGEPFEEMEVSRVFQALGFEVRGGKGENLLVRPPLHRLGDVHEEADLVEELARVRGFNRGPLRLPVATVSPPARDHRLSRLRHSLAQRGFCEVVSLIFMGETLLRKAGGSAGHLVQIENPLGRELSSLRLSLLPQLLILAARTWRQSHVPIHLFEVGRVFLDDVERCHLSLLSVEPAPPSPRTHPAASLRSLLSEVATLLSLPSPLLHLLPSPVACPLGERWEIRHAGVECGELLHLQEPASARWGVPQGSAALTLDWDALRQWNSSPQHYVPPPVYPTVTYDITIPSPAGVSAAQLLERAGQASPLLRDVYLLDVFRGEQGETWTFRCTYGVSDRTLREEEAKAAHGAVVAVMQS